MAVPRRCRLVTALDEGLVLISVSFHTTASSMPATFKKTLVCSYKIGPNTAGGLSGNWLACGQASGTVASSA